MKFFKPIILLTLILLFNSCDNELSENQDVNNNLLKNSENPYEKSGRLGTDAEDIMRNAILEFSDLLKNLKVEDDAYKELFYLFQNNHYVDSYVPLSDLLNHESAMIYERSDVSKFTKGSFKTFFNSQLDSNPTDYVNLSHVLNNRLTLVDDAIEAQKNELFFDIANITLYTPTIINEKTENLFLDDDLFVIVPGVIDANEGLGYELNMDTGNWDETTVNTDTTNENFTIIIEPNYHCNENEVPVIAEIYGESNCSSYSGGYSGGDIGGIDPENGGWDGGTASTNGNPLDINQYTGNCDDIKDGNYIRQVFIGHIRAIKQYDKLISLSGNGGGSEFQFTRTDSRENLEDLPNDSNVDVFNFTERFEIYITRYAIRKERERWYSVAWDFNWECAEPKHEQLLVIYEKDLTDPIDFDFSGIEWEGETYGGVSLEVEVRTKNEIIRTWKRDASEFFVSNMLSDYGCNCKDGEHSFSDRCWPRYDCNANVRYTMPHRWIPN